MSTTVEETNMEAILEVMNTTKPVMKIRPEKNSGPYDTSQRSTNCPTSRLREFICNQHNNKLSVGLVAQRRTAALRCTGNVKVMDSNPVRV